MPKLPILKPREIIAVLMKTGFHEVCQKGSHINLSAGTCL